MAPDPCPPDPPAGLDPLVETLPEAAEFYRIHAPAFGAAQFNPWTNLKAQPTRFAPSPGPRGRPVPTLYAAPSFAVALAESLFHDLPRDSAEVVVPASRLGELTVSRLRVRRELRLAMYRGASLRRMRVEWSRLIGCPADCYSQTREWAEAAHQHAEVFDGLIWSSRQYDGAPALMLFGDRINARALRVLEDRVPLADARYREAVLEECEKAGITLSPA